MFESGGTAEVAERIGAVVIGLAGIARDLSDAARIDVLGALEDLKSACAAAQAKVTADFDRSRKADRASRGVPVAQQCRGIAAEVGLARRDSPKLGGRHLGFARALTEEMPHTLALLERGQLTEWRATVLVRETACLTREDREAIDRNLCADPKRLAGFGDRAIAAAARREAASLDPEAMVRRAGKAVADRRVTSRPAPDTMAYVSALLPMKDAVTVHATLLRDAAAIVAVGDERTKSQIMADLLVQRVTGVATATEAPVTVNVVLSDEALLAGGAEPAEVVGYGPVPAGVARQWIHDAADREAVVELRRIYAKPGTGALTAMESKSRYFPKTLARLIDARDRTCRTPWCDAPIRHRDHIKSHESGGKTTIENGAGLCEACNYAKQGADWTAEPESRAPGQRHRYTFTTPTGHVHRSTAPPLPRPLPCFRSSAWQAGKRASLECCRP
ncbi:HNH endonuclease signature motif containing protein [Antrihabitans sp. YC2-6]|uniref:HNH endonuclease n=1 Tax=Antrihabitans sp. YC2-6 TaxID=2799498 RepID=UPI0018F3D62D|nr:HNH endonuclease signature motif containing protein [Antrihabitans sp. YC2-6]MBJ8346359.1 DUF222 domain-containing protein [Antrihabitans sp. YC2-6]